MRYRLSVLPLNESVSAQIGTFELALDAESYFRLRIEDRVVSDGTFVRGEFVALFVLGPEYVYGEGLLDAFRNPSCIYRDVVALSKEHAQLWAEAIDQIAEGDRRGACEEYPLRDLVNLYIEVAGPNDEKYVLRPVRFEMNRAVLALYFSGTAVPERTSTLDAVSLNIVAETPLLKERRVYPIIMASFTYDPEVIVRFHPECVEGHSWTSFMVSGASGREGIVMEPDADGNGYRLHTRNHAEGRARWVFPGSGVMVTWTPR